MPDVSLTRRSIPIKVKEAEAREDVFRVADLLIRGGDERAALSASSEARSLSARVLSRLLVDVVNAGWGITFDDGELYVLAPDERAGRQRSPAEVQAEKARGRRRAHARVREQLSEDGPRRFVATIEARAAVDLFADGPSLADALAKDGAAAIRPVLEPARAQDGDDATTGAKRWDVFRYLRFLWSFPYESTPGRTVPFLIRDEGQPNRPVCGLLCLTSPIPKLRVRDEALGLAPAWLEALIALIDLDGTEEATARLLSELKRSAASGGGVNERKLAMDLGALVGERLDGVEHAARWLAASGEEQRHTARAALTKSLLQELERAIRGISFAGFDVDADGALADPERWATVLEEAGVAAQKAWRASRSEKHSATNSRNRDGVDQLLFHKKRTVQLAKLLKAWAEVAQLGLLFGEPLGLAHALRHATSRREGCFNSLSRLNGGESVGRGLKAAIDQRKWRFLASQVMDVSVCGAIPPYGDLLGGKLASLAPFSRDVVAAYHEAYSKTASHIQSLMAGVDVFRSAELVALTTTSFYAVGSSQYNRVVLPPELANVGWRHVGRTEGFGSSHISNATMQGVQQLLDSTGKGNLVTSRFGEGPSERMRKLRDGIEELGLPADELLRHGAARLVYIAEFQGSLLGEEPPYRETAPSFDQVATFWRERWLKGRLTKERLDRLRTFERFQALVSQVQPTRDNDEETRPEELRATNAWRPQP